MRSFSFGGKWWHYLVPVTVKGGPLFFLSWFVFCLSFTLRGGRLVLRHIGVFGSLSCVPVCFSLSFVFLPSEARRLFFFGVWPVGFTWFGREKNFYLIFFGLLLFIVVLGTFHPSRVRLFGNIHVVLVHILLCMLRQKEKRCI